MKVKELDKTIKRTIEATKTQDRSEEARSPLNEGFDLPSQVTAEVKEKITIITRLNEEITTLLKGFLLGKGETDLNYTLNQELTKLIKSSDKD